MWSSIFFHFTKNIKITLLDFFNIVYICDKFWNGSLATRVNVDCQKIR